MCPSIFQGTVSMGPQCLCHLLIAFSAMVEAMALCRRPRKKKKVRLPIWSWQVESRDSTQFRLRREWRAAARLWKPGQTKEIIEGERKTNPLTHLVDLGLQESDKRLTGALHCTAIPVIQQAQQRAMFQHSNVLDHREYIKHPEHPFTLSD